jgi:hypothetical protein
MTLKVKVRQTIEFIVEVDDSSEYEVECFNEEVKNGEVDMNHSGVKGESKVLLTEIVEREHQTNYVIGMDKERELYLLQADGVDVFANRSHNEVVREWGRRTNNEVTFTTDAAESWNRNNSVWFDYGDPDRSWDLLKARQDKKEAEDG